MALVNVITIDLVAKTAVLTSTSAGNGVETITYTNSTNQITFSTRADIVISGADFINLIDQINIFQTAILFNFAPNAFATIPFGSCDNSEVHDIVNNNWNLACIYGASPRAINYSGLGASKTVDLLARASPKIIDFPEWIYCLYALNHYRISIRNFFSI